MATAIVRGPVAVVVYAFVPLPPSCKTSETPEGCWSPVAAVLAWLAARALVVGDDVAPPTAAVVSAVLDVVYFDVVVAAVDDTAAAVASYSGVGTLVDCSLARLVSVVVG
jgi:hypothetical protein